VNHVKEIALAALNPGQTGIVYSFSQEGNLTQRLKDLGLVPGTSVACLGRSPLGDPSAYQIRGAVIALRRRDSSRVRVAL